MLKIPQLKLMDILLGYIKIIRQHLLRQERLAAALAPPEHRFPPRCTSSSSRFVLWRYTININILRIFKVKRAKFSQTIQGKMSLTVTQQSHYILMTRESAFQRGSLMAKTTEMSHNDMTILLCDILPCTQNILE